jgi:hypothetical protein
MALGAVQTSVLRLVLSHGMPNSKPRFSVDLDNRAVNLPI